MKPDTFFAPRVATLAVLLLLFIAPMPAFAASAAESKRAITILYDAFGKHASMRKDWGFAALIEYRGKRILFDTGNDPQILAHNAKATGVDLSNLDFFIMSHRHGDHMGGMSYLLRVNPGVRIYAPQERRALLRWRAASVMEFGSAWPGANIELIERTVEISPGLHFIALVSDKPTTLELRELSLAINTPEDVVLLVGCSHPGIEKIVQAATAIDPHIHLIAGGFHLVVAQDAEIARIVSGLRDKWHVAYVAPGHCTGEPSFVALKRMFRERYLYAGVSSTIVLGVTPRTVAASPSHRVHALDMPILIWLR